MLPGELSERGFTDAMPHRGELPGPGAHRDEASRQ